MRADCSRQEIIASLHIDSIDHMTDKEKKGKSECQSGDEHQCIEWLTKRRTVGQSCST